MTEGNERTAEMEETLPAVGPVAEGPVSETAAEETDDLSAAIADAEQNLEQTAEDTQEVSTEQPMDAPAEEPAEAPAEVPEESAGQEAEEMPGEGPGEPSEAPAEEAAEGTEAEPSEAPAEEAAEAPTDEQVAATAPRPHGVSWWPFVIYDVVWLLFSAAIVWQGEQLPPGVAVFESPLYPLAVLGGVILTIAGPLVILVAWIAAWREGVSKGTLFVSALVRGAVATLLGVTLWWGALVLLDQLRLGRLV